MVPQHRQKRASLTLCMTPSGGQQGGRKGHPTYSLVSIRKNVFWLKQNFISRIRRNLFIHKARIPARRFSSSTSQHFKMFPPFASNEGYSANGLRYQSDGVRVTHPLPHSEFTRIRERMCDLTLTLSHSPFAYYSYFKNMKKHVYSQSTNPCKAILLEYIPTF